MSRQPHPFVIDGGREFPRSRELRLKMWRYCFAPLREIPSVYAKCILAVAALRGGR
jgi:hypothetical protein